MTAAVTLSLLAAARWAWDHQREWLARHRTTLLPRAPDDSLDGLLEGAAGLGEPEAAPGRSTPDSSSRERPRTIDTALQWDTPLLASPGTTADSRTGFQPVGTRPGFQPVESRPHLQPVAPLPDPPVAPLSDMPGEPNPPAAPSSDQAVGHLPRPKTASEEQALGPETLAVVRRLQAQDPRDAAEARAELKRRGFADREVALARQLSDPDPHVRRRLVRLLPEIAGLDAVPWLVELSRDADADVRWTALTLLATTQDPALLRRVGELVRGDPDPRIQRLAERLGQTPR